MTWFRVDDQSPFHRKVIAAGNEAWGAFCRGGAVSSGQRTDGFVADEVAFLIAAEPIWKRLVEVKLAHREDGGWRLHDYTDWNPTAKEVEKLRKAKASAGKVGGRASGKRRAEPKHSGEADAQASASEDVEPRAPVVGEASGEAQGEDQERSGSGSGSSPNGGAGGSRSKPRGTRCPASDVSAADLDAWLMKLGISRSPEVDHWLDHHRAKGSIFVEWAAAWRTWQRNGARFGRGPVGARGGDKRDRFGNVVGQGHLGLEDHMPEVR